MSAGIDYKDLIRRLDACVFTVIDPQLAKEASTALRLLLEESAAHKDTGLEPEEIKELLSTNEVPPEN